MKKIITLIILITFVMMSISTQVDAASKRERSVKFGQKIFKKKFRKYCRFSGVRFARKHTQDEWEEIWDEKLFIKEAKKICPRLNLRRIKRSWWKHVYRFMYEYGEGSTIPAC